MIIIITLLVLGLFLSAFFSGSETGFYRVTRVRLVMDAKSGGWMPRILLWLVNHTSVVVATVLIGNNIANYLVSLGLLLVSERWFVGWGQMQTLLPVLMTPLLFIYGELLPKYLYYQVPYKLLNRGAPLMVLFTVLFLPVSFIVIALERLWQRSLAGGSIKAGSTFERQELQRVLVEGQEAGVLQSVQREIAQNLFTFGVRPVRQFAVPIRAIALVDKHASRDEILSQSTRRALPFVGVMDETNQRMMGCYVVADLLIGPQQLPVPLPVLRVAPSESTIQALIKLQGSPSPFAVVEDSAGKTLGVVEKERLMSLLLSAG